MRVAYFDCPSGISGNMILGALIDTGLDVSFLTAELAKLQAPRHKQQTNYKLQITKTKKHWISGTFVNVKISKVEKHRDLKDILSIISRSKLSKTVKERSGRIFRRLAGAEAKAHGVAVNQVHFHEVGAVDAIVDIVGACVGLEKLGIEKIYCSPLPHGKGIIKHSHGLLPNPAPATAELLKGVPTYGTNIRGELVTPTGAAIISTLAEFGDPPRLRVERIGYGAGSLDLPIPNLLRVFIGKAEIPADRDAILQIETNIDDMDPRAFPKVIAKLIKAGALEAYITPILMKKERKATLLTALCEPKMRDIIIEAFFSLTTTFGVRVYLVSREKLQREFKVARTKFGRARVKLGRLGKQLMTIAAEYEDYRRLAAKHRVPIATTYREILRQFKV